MIKFIKKHKILFIIIFSIFFGYFLSPIGGLIHKSIFGVHDCSFWGPCDSGDNIEGFIHFFVGFFVFFSFYFLDKRSAIKNLFSLFILDLALGMWLGYWEGIFLNIFFALFGWSLVQLISFIVNRTIKNK